MPATFHAKNLASVGGFEPQRLNHFEVRLHGIAGVDGRVITLSTMSFQPPSRSVAVEEIMYGNESVKYAGRVTYENASLILRDYVDHSTYGVLWDWMELVHNSTSGALGWCRDYKKTGDWRMYAPDGRQARFGFMTGVWPTTLTTEQFSMDSSEQNQITIELAVDRFEAEDRFRATDRYST